MVGEGGRGRVDEEHVLRLQHQRLVALWVQHPVHVHPVFAHHRQHKMTDAEVEVNARVHA